MQFVVGRGDAPEGGDGEARPGDAGVRQGECLAQRKKSFPFTRIAYGYTNAIILANDGKVLLRLLDDLDTGPNLLTGPLKDSGAGRRGLSSARMFLQAEVSDYQLDPGERQPRCFLAAPVFSLDGVNFGVFVVQIGNAGVYSILNDYEGLGETGEVVAGQLKGDELVINLPTSVGP